MRLLFPFYRWGKGEPERVNTASNCGTRVWTSVWAKPVLSVLELNWAGSSPSELCRQIDLKLNGLFCFVECPGMNKAGAISLQLLCGRMCGITAWVNKCLLGQEMPTVHRAFESWGKRQWPVPEAACLSGWVLQLSFPVTSPRPSSSVCSGWRLLGSFPEISASSHQDLHPAPFAGAPLWAGEAVLSGLAASVAWLVKPAGSEREGVTG